MTNHTSIESFIEISAKTEDPETMIARVIKEESIDLMVMGADAIFKSGQELLSALRGTPAAARPVLRVCAVATL
jgi:nucleotide-binding universal stress UspA family protein